MAEDLFLPFGGDLELTVTGDLALAAAPVLGQQRVLRRLLTNPGDAIFDPTYGAGLARYIGQPTNAPGIQAAVQAQLVLETAVLQSPPPTAAVQGDATGTVTLTVTYVDASTGAQQTAVAPLGGSSG